MAALENKTGALVKSALETIITQSGRKPNKIHSDKGKEFINETVNKYLQESNIELYHKESENKSSIVERVVRTIRDRIEPMLTEKEFKNENASWVKCLPEVLDWYNKQHIHRTTKMTPEQASLEQSQNKLEQ